MMRSVGMAQMPWVDIVFPGSAGRMDGAGWEITTNAEVTKRLRA